MQYFNVSYNLLQGVIQSSSTPGQPTTICDNRLRLLMSCMTRRGQCYKTRQLPRTSQLSMSLTAPEFACPECGKVFQDERRVTLHLNNPRSACNSWIHEQVAMLGNQTPGQTTAGQSDEDLLDNEDFPDDDDPYMVNYYSLQYFLCILFCARTMTAFRLFRHLRPRHR